MNARARIEYFYAYSYCSYECGTNEINNRLVRQHIQKETDISQVSEEKLKK